jgi:hypothetical protein
LEPHFKDDGSGIMIAGSVDELKTNIASERKEG